MIPSVEQLVSIALNYWPATLDAYLHPGTCPQFEKFQERWQHELAHMDRWRAFLAALKGDLPQFVVGDATATVDASFRCAVYPTQGNRPPNAYWAVVGCVSILAPVYTTYAVQYELRGKRHVDHRLFFDSLPTEMQEPADAISRRIEATFEFSALAPEVARTFVPLCVDPHQPPETTLFHALFTSQPKSVP